MESKEWTEIHYNWLYRLEDLDTPIDNIAHFEIIQVKSDRSLYGIDWWPKSTYLQRSEWLKAGRFPYWETRKGTLHTAELLFKNRGNIERQSAILIMASLDVKMKDLPKEWRGKTNLWIEEMFKTIRETFAEIEVWHHASREALPITIGRYYPACEFIHPETPQHLIYLFALEASLSLGNWQLVNVFSGTGLKAHLEHLERLKED